MAHDDDKGSYFSAHISVVAALTHQLLFMTGETLKFGGH